MIKNPCLAGLIDGALLRGDITEWEARVLHKWRRLGSPKCLGGPCPPWKWQDIYPCELCRKIRGER